MEGGPTFSEEQMGLLASAPSRIGHAMMIASRTRFFGARKEMRAMREAITAKGERDGEIVTAVRDMALIRLREEGGHRGLRKRRDEYTQETIGLCREISRILEGVQGADAYMAWLLRIGEEVARALPTDEFMGVGGVVISREQERLLVSLAEALGVEGYSIMRE